MSSIQKELEQLEKWLGGSLPHPEPSHSTDSLLTAVERLSKQFEVQQHALNHIVDRLDILEGVRNEPRYMDLHDDPWLDHSPTQLQNEIIDPIEPLYHICKTDTLFEAAPSLPVVEQKPMVEKKHVVGTPVVEQSSVSLVPQSVVEEQQEEEEEEPPKEQEEEEQEEEEEEQEEAREEPPKEQQEEQEEQEEEEDEGVELLEYKGVSYYKDSEGFIYSIEEDEQPSEIAIGYWKEKTNSIAFYKK